MPIRHVIWAQSHHTPNYSEVICRVSFSIWIWKFTFSKPELSLPQMFLFSQPVHAPHRVLLRVSSMHTSQVRPPVFIHKSVCGFNLGVCCPGAVSNPETHADTLNLYNLHFSYGFLYLQSVLSILFIPSPSLLPLTSSSSLRCFTKRFPRVLCRPQTQLLKGTGAIEDKPGLRIGGLIHSSVQTQACICQALKVKSWHLPTDSACNPVPSWAGDIHRLSQLYVIHK